MRLRPADDDEQRARDRLSHAAWGAQLTADQFVAREARLRAHAWSRDALTSWLLVDDAGAPLASCETYRMPTAAGDVFGVASVFVEEQLRGRGHATRLMGLLDDALATLGARAAILFSDVGPAIYERVGYVARPAWDRVLPARDGELRATLLLDGELVVPRPPDGALVWPTAEQLDWHVERERAYAQLLGRARPAAVGARSGGASIAWAADLKRGTLHVLCLDVAELADGAELLRTAQIIAARAGLVEVRRWDAGEPDGLDGERVARDGSLPMVRPFAPSLRAEDWQIIPKAIWV
jgi:predicted N-acetyltransferase YhbS